MSNSNETIKLSGRSKSNGNQTESLEMDRMLSKINPSMFLNGNSKYNDQNYQNKNTRVFSEEVDHIRNKSYKKEETDDSVSSNFVSLSQSYQLDDTDTDTESLRDKSESKRLDFVSKSEVKFYGRKEESDTESTYSNKNDSGKRFSTLGNQKFLKKPKRNSKHSNSETTLSDLSSSSQSTNSSEAVELNLSSWKKSKSKSKHKNNKDKPIILSKHHSKNRSNEYQKFSNGEEEFPDHFVPKQNPNEASSDPYNHIYSPYIYPPQQTQISQPINQQSSQINPPVNDQIRSETNQNLKDSNVSQIQNFSQNQNVSQTQNGQIMNMSMEKKPVNLNALREEMNFLNENIPDEDLLLSSTFSTMEFEEKPKKINEKFNRILIEDIVKNEIRKLKSELVCHTGPTGCVGIPGRKGVDGLPGLRGSDGLAGNDGKPGRIGQIGPVGQNGQTGPTGPTGSIGGVGPTGPENRCSNGPKTELILFELATASSKSQRNVEYISIASLIPPPLKIITSFSNKGDGRCKMIVDFNIFSKFPYTATLLDKISINNLSCTLVYSADSHLINSSPEIKSSGSNRFKIKFNLKENVSGMAYLSITIYPP